jgi:hypothetical protein
MARRARRRAGAGGAGKIALAVALVMISLTIIGGAAYLRYQAGGRPKLAAGTLCPIDGERAMTVVLIDASDDLPDIARRQLLGSLTELADEMPEYGRLEFRVLSTAAEGGELVFDKCNPGDGSNLSELVANPALARRRWAEGFKEPLEAALTAGLSPSPSETSPIMETIQAIAVDRFSSSKVEGIPKKLVIISDMIQNAKDYSQYKGDLSFGRYKESRAYRRLHTDLHGAEVAIWYVQRSKGQIDSGRHITFWKSWVEDNGGRLSSAEKLQGEG